MKKTVLSTTALSLEESRRKAELITIDNPTQLESDFTDWKMKRKESFSFSRLVRAQPFTAHVAIHK